MQFIPQYKPFVTDKKHCANMSNTSKQPKMHFLRDFFLQSILMPTHILFAIRESNQTWASIPSSNQYSKNIMTRLLFQDESTIE